MAWQTRITSFDFGSRLASGRGRYFLPAFLTACTALFIAVQFAPRSLSFRLDVATAHCLALVLGMLGLEPLVRGACVACNGLSAKIITECTFIYSTIPFVCFVLFHSKSFREKGLLLFSGICLLFIANTLRLVLIFVCGLWFPPKFDTQPSIKLP